MHRDSAFLHRLILDTRDEANLDEALGVALADICAATGWLRGEMWMVEGDRLCLGPWYVVPESESQTKGFTPEEAIDFNIESTHGLRDPAPMYGPIVFDDFRKEITQADRFTENLAVRLKAAMQDKIGGRATTFIAGSASSPARRSRISTAIRVA